MKQKKIVNLVLGVCAVLLLFISWHSISDTIGFDKEVAQREQVVKARLIDIRKAEEEYKAQHEGVYCAEWPELIEFVKNGRLPVVMKQGDLSDDQMDKGLTEASAAAIVNSGDLHYCSSLNLLHQSSGQGKHPWHRPPRHGYR